MGLTSTYYRIDELECDNCHTTLSLNRRDADQWEAPRSWCKFPSSWGAEWKWACSERCFELIAQVEYRTITASQEVVPA